MSETLAMVAMTTVPDETVATQLAETLVKEGLAACVHILPQGRSFYIWDGEFQKDEEWTLILKLRRDGYPQLEERLRDLHPYEVPELIALPVVEGYAPYLTWLAGSREG
ncbi:MAG: divalent-cation tolerance protein CutA [Magnetococcales bacterium]|nr:divalent-cation tolerance protein CutA [Magnetococcales bacterium]